MLHLPVITCSVVHPLQVSEQITPLHHHYLEQKVQQPHNGVVQVQMEAREVLWEQAWHLGLHHLQLLILFLGVDLPGKQVFLELNLLVKLLHSLVYSLPLNLVLVVEEQHYLDKMHQQREPLKHLLLAKLLQESIRHKLSLALSAHRQLLQLEECLVKLNRLQHLVLVKELGVCFLEPRLKLSLNSSSNSSSNQSNFLIWPLRASKKSCQTGWQTSSMGSAIFNIL